MASLIKQIVIKHDVIVLGEEPALSPPYPAKSGQSFPASDEIGPHALVSQVGMLPKAYQPLIDNGKSIASEEIPCGEQADEQSLNEAKIEARVQERLIEYEAKLKQTMDEAHAKGFAQGLIEGRAKGVDSGEAEGRTQGIAQYQNAIELLDKWRCQANEQLQNMVSDAEEIIGAIVFEAVCKIVGDTLKTPEGICALVNAAINGVKYEDILAIQVSPNDFKMLSSIDESELSQEQTCLKRLGLEESHEVELGGCIVKLKAGRIDARIDTQLHAFAESLKKAAHNS